MLLVITGTFFPGEMRQKHLFLSGGVLLTASAVLRRHGFFIALQIVLLTGTAVAYLPVATLYKVGLPIAVAVPVLIWRHRQGGLASALDRAGALGIVILAAGYAVSHWSVYLAGDLVVLTVSWIELRSGVREALVWVILNGVFAFGVLASLIGGL